MCFGCPSVATRVGGIPEVVQDGVTGILAPFGDSAALASFVAKLIDDDALRGSLAAAAVARARAQFSAENIVPRYEALYRRVTAAR